MPWLFRTLELGGSEDIFRRNQAEMSSHLGSYTASTGKYAESHYPCTPEKADHDMDQRKIVKEPESSPHLES